MSDEAQRLAGLIPNTFGGAMKLFDRFPIIGNALSEETTLLIESVSRWAEQELRSKRGKHGEDFDELIKPALDLLLHELGIKNLIWPGPDEDFSVAPTTAIAVLEQVGQADTGVAFALANTMAMARLAQAKDTEQYRNKGALVALVLPDYAPTDQTTEGFGGLSPQVEAQKKDGGWVLSGQDVRPQCFGREADFFGVVTSWSQRPHVFLVSGHSRGVTRSQVIAQTGLASVPNVLLRLNKVEVQQDCLWLQGHTDYQRLCCWYQMGVAASICGAMLEVYRILDDWCESRVIKGRGQAFKENSLVAAILGEIGGLIAVNRILTYNVGTHLSQNEASGQTENDLAIVTTMATRVCRDAMVVLDRAMELMGSAGYATEWQLERYWRDVKTVSTYLMAETTCELQLAKHYFGCGN